MIAPKQKQVVCLNQLRPEPVEWIWPGRLAAGKLALLDGDPEQGKSLLTLDIAARLTMARPFPDEYQFCQPGSVLLLAGEDSFTDTILPRLAAADADLSRVHTLATNRANRTWQELPVFPDDCGLLRETIQETGTRLVIVDPLLAFLSGQVSSVSDQWVRHALTPLAQVAEETRAAIVLVRHLTKGGHGRRALYRGTGAVAIIGAARTAFLAGRHPHEPGLRVLACSKNNLCEPPPTLGYRIVTGDNREPVIHWAGTMPVTADDLVLTPSRPAPDIVPEAVVFLSDLLAQGPRRRAEVLRLARAQGISERSLERAKAHLHVVSEQHWEADKNVWYWRHPNADEVGEILTELWSDVSEAQKSDEGADNQTSRTLASFGRPEGAAKPLGTSSTDL